MSSPAYVSYPCVLTAAGVGRRGFVDGSRLSQAYLDGPTDLTLLPDGSVLVSDSRNNCLRRLDPRTDMITTVPSQQFLGPRSPVVIDGGAAVIVADSGHNKLRMLRFISAGVPGFAALAEAGAGEGGSLVVEDCTVAGTGRAGLQDGPADTAMFNKPTGLAVIHDGSILVVDSLNHAIRRVAGRPGKPGLFVTTIIGDGTPGFVDGNTSTGKLRNPSSIVVDAYGTVLISDTGNSAIRALHPPPSGDMGAADWALTTVAGAGMAGLRDGDGALAPTLSAPTAMTLGVDGEVLVCDGDSIRALCGGGWLGPRAGMYCAHPDGTVEYVDGANVDALGGGGAGYGGGMTAGAGRGTRRGIGAGSGPLHTRPLTSAGVPRDRALLLLRVGLPAAEGLAGGLGGSTGWGTASGGPSAYATPTKPGRKSVGGAGGAAEAAAPGAPHRTLVLPTGLLHTAVGPEATADAFQALSPLASPQRKAQEKLQPRAALAALQFLSAPSPRPSYGARNRQSVATVLGAGASLSDATTSENGAAPAIHLVAYPDPARIEAVHRRYSRVMTVAGLTPAAAVAAGALPGAPLPRGAGPAGVEFAASVLGGGGKSGGAATRSRSAGRSGGAGAGLGTGAALEKLRVMLQENGAGAAEIEAAEARARASAAGAATIPRYADGLSTVEARFKRPSGLVVLPGTEGSVLVSDRDNNFLRLLISARAIDAQPEALRPVLTFDVLARVRHAMANERAAAEAAEREHAAMVAAWNAAAAAGAEAAAGALAGQDESFDTGRSTSRGGRRGGGPVTAASAVATGPRVTIATATQTALPSPRTTAPTRHPGAHSSPTKAQAMAAAAAAAESAPAHSFGDSAVGAATARSTFHGSVAAAAPPAAPAPPAFGVSGLGYSPLASSQYYSALDRLETALQAPQTIAAASKPAVAGLSASTLAAAGAMWQFSAPLPAVSASSGYGGPLPEPTYAPGASGAHGAGLTTLDLDAPAPAAPHEAGPDDVLPSSSALLMQLASEPLAASSSRPPAGPSAASLLPGGGSDSLPSYMRPTTGYIKRREEEAKERAATVAKAEAAAAGAASAGAVRVTGVAAMPPSAALMSPTVSSLARVGAASPAPQPAARRGGHRAASASPAPPAAHPDAPVYAAGTDVGAALSAHAPVPTMAAPPASRGRAASRRGSEAGSSVGSAPHPRGSSVTGGVTGGARSVSRARATEAANTVIQNGVPVSKSFPEALCADRARLAPTRASVPPASRDVLAAEAVDAAGAVVQALLLSDALSSSAGDAAGMSSSGGCVVLDVDGEAAAAAAMSASGGSPGGAKRVTTADSKLITARFARHTASSANLFKAKGRSVVRNAPAFVNVQTVVTKKLEELRTRAVGPIPVPVPPPAVPQPTARRLALHEETSGDDARRHAGAGGRALSARRGSGSAAEARTAPVPVAVRRATAEVPAEVSSAQAAGSEPVVVPVVAVSAPAPEPAPAAAAGGATLGSQDLAILELITSALTKEAAEEVRAVLAAYNRGEVGGAAAVGGGGKGKGSPSTPEQQAPAARADRFGLASPSDD